jgi:hypothetical protein
MSGYLAPNFENIHLGDKAVSEPQWPCFIESTCFLILTSALRFFLLLSCGDYSPTRTVHRIIDNLSAFTFFLFNLALHDTDKHVHKAYNALAVANRFLHSVTCIIPYKCKFCYICLYSSVKF